MSANKICFCIPENCDACYEYSVPYCPPALINVPTTNLSNGATYYVWLRDKFNNVWSSTASGLADGTFNIDTTAYPTGMFSPDFGAMDIYLSTDSLGSMVQQLNLYGYLAYDCIILTVDQPVYLTDDSGCVILTDDLGNALIAQ